MKLKSIILLISLTFVFAVALISCDMFPTVHEHSWVDATCTAPKTCSDCGETEGEALGHVAEDLEAREATCTEKGLTQGKRCSVCSDVIVAQTEVPALGHTEVIDAAVEADCDSTGLTEGKHCDTCGDIIVMQTEIPALGHTEVVDAAVAPDCDSTGLTEGKHCGTCDYVFVAQEVISALGHTEVVDAAVAADCTNAGKTEGKHCSVCFEVLVAQEVVPALGHTEVVDAAVEADCTNAGKTEGKHCSVCSEVLVAQETVAALGHKDENKDYKCDVCKEELCTDHIAADAVKENEVAPTCTKAGSYESVVKCSRCGEELSREAKTIDASGHKEEVLAAKAATCTETGLTEGKKCSVCGEILIAQEQTAVLGHAYEVSCEWSDDNSTCTVTQVCENDASHSASETITVSKIVLNVSASKVTYTYCAGEQTKNIEEAVAIENNIATVNTPTIAGRVASHDYVKFGFHDEAATYEFTIYYSGVDVWDGTSVSTSLTGSGTEEDPYLIQSAADFAYLETCESAGKYFKLTVSIDFNNNALSITSFAGILDGNNCSIRGINLNNATSITGLFKELASGSQVYDLTLYGTVSGAAMTGALAGKCWGSVTNVTNYATVSGTNTLGGLIGNSTNTSHVEECVSYGTVNGSAYYVGGVIGWASGKVASCVNFGSVNDTGDNVGGVVGFAESTVSYCINYGNVTTSVGNAGGIVMASTSTVEYCVNYGTITGPKAVGGIIGLVTGGKTATISNCTNNGTVTVDGQSGGILGLIQANGKATITDCTNNGDIPKGYVVGGIAGYPVNGATIIITDCVNNGNITGTSGLSGILGQAGNGDGGAVATITGCTNNGKVTSTSTSIGGILGNVENGSTVTISECDNYGAISGSTAVGGILGQVNSGSSTVSITQCTNNGNVSHSGWTGAGGIAGKMYGSVSDCINNGTVSGKAINGGIVGACYGTVTGCTNTGAISVTVNSCGGIVGELHGTALEENILATNTNTGTITCPGTAKGDIIGQTKAS